MTPKSSTKCSSCLRWTTRFAKIAPSLKRNVNGWSVKKKYLRSPENSNLSTEMMTTDAPTLHITEASSWWTKTSSQNWEVQAQSWSSRQDDKSWAAASTNYVKLLPNLLQQGSWKQGPSWKNEVHDRWRHRLFLLRENFWKTPEPGPWRDLRSIRAGRK